jgi:hypothetical protein
MKVKHLLFIFALLYLVWLPLGSAPIYIADKKLDVMIGVFFSSLLLFYLLAGGGIKRKILPSSLLYILLFYLFTLFLSTLFSENSAHSWGRFSVIAGYALVSVLIPLILADYIPKLSISMAYFAALSSFLLWLSYLVLGMSSWGRMTIPTWTGSSFQYFPQGWGTSADPNTLGTGLLLSAVYGLCFLEMKKNRRVFLFLFSVSGGLLTFSRTAFLGFFMGLIIAWLLEIVQNKSKKTVNIFHKIKIIFIYFIPVILISLFFLNGFIEDFIQRITGTSNGGRINLINAVIENWLSKDESMLLGIGFDTTIITLDPHNIYVATLHDSGVLGLTALITLIVSIIFYININIKTEKYRFYANWIIFFISFSGLSYWHTKNFWFSIMFVLMIIIYEKKKRKNI